MLAPTSGFFLFLFFFSHIPVLQHFFLRRKRRKNNKVKLLKEEFLRAVVPSDFVSTDKSNIFTAALHQVAVTSTPRAPSFIVFVPFFFAPPALFVVQRGAVTPPRCLSGEPSCTLLPPPPRCCRRWWLHKDLRGRRLYTVAM